MHRVLPSHFTDTDMPDWYAGRLFTNDANRKKRIAIIGGGLTGLTAAKELLDRGFAVTIFEDDSRLGGHIKTVPAAREGLFIEAGAELISGSHHHILELAKSLGLPVEEFAPKDSTTSMDTLLHIGGQFYSTAKFEKAFAPLAEAIAEDESQLYWRSEAPITHAKEIAWNRGFASSLDALSLTEYLQEKRDILARRGIILPDWLISAIEISYGGEIGRDANDISALTFVTLLNTSLLRNGQNLGMEMPGEQNAIYRIRGGNEELIRALTEHVLSKSSVMDSWEGRDVIRHNAHVSEVQSLKNGSAINVLYTQDGMPQKERFDGIVTTMSMTRLKDIQGVDRLMKSHGASTKSIHTLKAMQESELTKITFQTKLPPSSIFATLNAGEPFEGFIYTDSGPQTIWVSSVNQRDYNGVTPTTGLITCYISGNTAMKNPKILTEECERAILNMLRQAKPELTREAVFTDFPATISQWTGTQHGCFVAPGRGQFLPLCEFNPYHSNVVTTGSFVPVISSNSTTDTGQDMDIQLGYMNNAVMAGKEAAAHLERHFARQKAATRG